MKALAQALKFMSNDLADKKKSLAILKAKETKQTIEQVSKYAPDNAELSIWAWPNALHIDFEVQNLDSLKDAPLQAFLAAVDALGYESRYTTDDTFSTPSRTYRYAKRSTETSPRIEVTVRASVKADSQTCRLVVVGTETRTIEKREIVCE